MAIKKYLTLDRLEEYHILSEQNITNKDDKILSLANTHSDNNLTVAQTYTDNAVSSKSQVQIITWGADD